MNYHESVLLNESVNGLEIRPNGIYIDLTYGGGGHTKRILEQLDKGKVIAFDQDLDAQANLVKDPKLIFVNHNFRFLKHFVRFHGFEKVDGILADLGVSSHHFDSPDRGFTFRYNAPLDMRMNTNLPHTAADVLNTYQERNLMQMFREYGEIDNAPRLVRQINGFRQTKPFGVVEDLKEALHGMIPPNQENKFLAKVFQALRIEVNREIEYLKAMLIQTPSVVKSGGRLVVISYHSLEDRLVKNFIKAGNFEGKEDKDFYGNVLSPFEKINRKVIVPSEDEIKQNNRARSARLRIGVRT